MNSCLISLLVPAPRWVKNDFLFSFVFKSWHFRWLFASWLLTTYFSLPLLPSKLLEGRGGHSFRFMFSGDGTMPVQGIKYVNTFPPTF